MLYETKLLFTTTFNDTMHSSRMLTARYMLAVLLDMLMDEPSFNDFSNISKLASHFVCALALTQFLMESSLNSGKLCKGMLGSPYQEFP